MEIERKWLVSRFPENVHLKINSKVKMEQIYISTEPEVRLRKRRPDGDYPRGIPYRIAVKGEGTIARPEFQSEIDGAFYDDMVEHLQLAPIRKYIVNYDDGNGHEISIACVDDDWYYAEVEFDSIEEALDYKFPWPEIEIADVTDDPNYKMKNYWKRTRLKKK